MAVLFSSRIPDVILSHFCGTSCSVASTFVECDQQISAEKIPALVDHFCYRFRSHLPVLRTTAHDEVRFSDVTLSTIINLSVTALNDFSFVLDCKMSLQLFFLRVL